MARDARLPQRKRRLLTRVGGLAGAAALTVFSCGTASWAAPHHTGTATPIKHVVVIFGENISFDHYFATYPNATNEDGTPFKAAPHTPKVDNLANAGLLKKNPNQYLPKRLSAKQGVTCDQNHAYSPEQYAYNGAKADKFVQYTDSGKCSGNLFGEPGLVMDYYDGNTVTAWWNYAQHYALNDHSFSDVYGPSTPGAINVISGNTHGIVSMDSTTGTENPKQTDEPDPYTVVSPDENGVGTMINDPDPAYDDCSGKDHTSTDALGAYKSSKNIGDLLNAKHVSWGWFQAGFKPGTAWDGQQGHYAECGSVTHANYNGAQVEDYSPHHEPFQYYKSTANPHHLPPKSVKEIGHDGQANHQYDVTDFDAALKTGNLPAVSYLKAAASQDAHAGNSSPMDEQRFLIKEINAIQQSPQWKDTAVVLAFDDSDGWYDHVAAKVLNGSKDSTANSKGDAMDTPACQSGPAAAGGYADRCGPGTRQPLMVISPYSKVNAVDHTQTQQSSIVQFIEDNWNLGRIGDSSFDAGARSLNGLFDYRHPHQERVLLNDDGSVKSVSRTPAHVAVQSAAAVDAAQYAGNDLVVADDGPGVPTYAAATAAAVVVLAGAGVGYAVILRRKTQAGAAG
ncbi:phospholipase C [Streptomyces odontomachi]|uniref:phospholipase C n=1 Tax=Streptomyces odontomachi TaxID=2944940 RepID=UPI00210C2D3C|nr:alkaline phosphatase family protein [Streptomyces sp. ODS25]